LAASVELLSTGHVSIVVGYFANPDHSVTLANAPDVRSPATIWVDGGTFVIGILRRSARDGPALQRTQRPASVTDFIILDSAVAGCTSKSPASRATGTGSRRDHLRVTRSVTRP